MLSSKKVVAITMQARCTPVNDSSSAASDVLRNGDEDEDPALEEKDGKLATRRRLELTDLASSR